MRRSHDHHYHHPSSRAISLSPPRQVSVGTDRGVHIFINTCLGIQRERRESPDMSYTDDAWKRRLVCLPLERDEDEEILHILQHVFLRGSESVRTPKKEVRRKGTQLKTARGSLPSLLFAFLPVSQLAFSSYEARERRYLYTHLDTTESCFPPYIDTHTQIHR